MDSLALKLRSGWKYLYRMLSLARKPASRTGIFTYVERGSSRDKDLTRVYLEREKHWNIDYSDYHGPVFCINANIKQWLDENCMFYYGMLNEAGTFTLPLGFTRKRDAIRFALTWL